MTAVLRMCSGRRLVVLAGLLILAFCFLHLGPRIINVSEGADPLATAREFFSAALSPALSDQNSLLPEDTAPFLQRVAGDLTRTFRYALIAMTLAVPLGLLLGFFASTAWWPFGLSYGRSSPWRQGVRFTLGCLRWGVRLLIAFMRSVHELIWAMFFLSALGDAPVTACIALALPFAGTLGKVFSELIDEQESSPRSVLQAGGASSIQSFFGAVLPQALPNLLTYTFYRFECALRSSAVLGFIGIETLGLGIRRSFDDLHYREVWTQLYLLIAVIIIIDRLGAHLRVRLKKGFPNPDKPVSITEPQLRLHAPRDWQLRGFGLGLVLLCTFAWNYGTSLTPKAGNQPVPERLARFATKLTPEPARPDHRLADWNERREAWKSHQPEVMEWATNLWESPGKEALGNTVAIASAAIILAALGAGLLLPYGSRALADRNRFGLLGTSAPWRQWLRAGLGFSVRGTFIATRAVPEYVYAYLLVALVGPSAWPLVFALAIHNTGILGRLWGESIENDATPAPEQLAASGAKRWQVYLTSLLPGNFNRFLLFLLYRWETCVREATILGMLGISSLGYYISISRHFLRYDQMLFFVMLGSGVIIVGDLFSDLLRRRILMKN